MSSKMKGDRWTPYLELKLVKLYKKCPCLWKTNSEAYKDLESRYAAYVKIVQLLKPEYRSLTVPKVVYKIRDIRYRYCVELTKIENAAVCGQNYIPIPPWFQVMQSFLDLRFRSDELKETPRQEKRESASTTANYFLDDYTGVRLTSSKCKIIYENNLKIDESKSTVGEFVESGNDAANYNTVDDDNNVCYKIREAYYNKESGVVEKIQHIQRDKYFLDNEENSSIKTMKKSWTKTLLLSSDNDDEFTAFAMSIGSQLKTLNIDIVKKLEIMILFILNDERSKSLKKKKKKKS